MANRPQSQDAELSKTQELKDLGPSLVIDQTHGSIAEGLIQNGSFEDDALAMKLMGKTQVFKRRITLAGACGLCICMTATYEGISASMFTALVSGGAASLIWGFAVVAVASLCMAASLAEIASIWPTSGAQYHWTAQLAPHRLRAALSWYVGICSIATSIVAVLGMAFACGVQIQAYAILANPSYVPERWHVVLIVYAVTTIYLFTNIFSVKYFDSMNKAVMGVHVVFFFVTMITLLATATPKNSGAYVFTDVEVGSGWENPGIAFCIGLQSAGLGFVAIDGPAHFSEELQHASRNLPRAIFWTVAITAVITFPWLIALAFSMGSIYDLLESPIAASSPMTVVFYQATGNIGASIFLSVPIILVGFMGGLDIMGSGSRTLWALARDRAFPNRVAHVHSKLNVPVIAILIFSAPVYVLALIYIWNTTAFYSIISGILVTQMPTYAVPIALRLSKRNIQLGPWNLGRFGILVHSVSLAWCIFFVVFLCFPIYQPVTSENMNYASAILGAVILLGTVGYVTYVRKRYNGPVNEL